MNYSRPWFSENFVFVCLLWLSSRNFSHQRRNFTLAWCHLFSSFMQVCVLLDNQPNSFICPLVVQKQILVVSIEPWSVGLLYVALQYESHGEDLTEYINYLIFSYFQELMEDFLFPASKVVVQTRKNKAETPLDPVVPVCASSASVNAAFDLLVALCVNCVANMKLVVETLREMYYSGKMIFRGKFVPDSHLPFFVLLSS